MHLLHLDKGGKLILSTFDTDDVPSYAILSHTWGAEADELTFQDIKNGTGRDKPGYAKVQFCGHQANQDGLRYFWVDSCCINKASFNGETSEAIASMFRWYKCASRCYVHLQDVSTRKHDRCGRLAEAWVEAFLGSRWFTRGWTLQELLAPRIVQFYSKDWSLVGDKVSLESLIHQATSIPVEALRGAKLSGFTVAERMRWRDRRKTLKVEDNAYCLVGMFDVSIPFIYGERGHAFARLFDAIGRRWGRQNLTAHFRSAHGVYDYPQSSTSETTAIGSHKRRRELIESLAFEQMGHRQLTVKSAQSTTCQWILQHPKYVAWSRPDGLPADHILWITGKPGAGKSTMMKFLLTYATENSLEDEIVASFFFNAQGQDLEKSAVGFYRSVLVQLLQSVPGLEVALRSISAASLERSQANLWTPEVLSQLFAGAVKKLSSKSVIFFIDALDECEEYQVRDMLALLEDLRDHTYKSKTLLKFCMASRHYPEIRPEKGLSMCLEDEDGHDDDLDIYIRRQLGASDSILGQQIRKRIKERANGVFMWIVLALSILSRDYLARRLWVVEKKLEDLPERLNDLFQDIIKRDTRNMDEFLLCLQWLLFAINPLSPEELYHAMVVTFDERSRGPLDPSKVSSDDIAKYLIDCSKGLAEVAIAPHGKHVRFIHESVRDFLVNDGGLVSLWPHLSGHVTHLSYDALKRCCKEYLTASLSCFDPWDDWSKATLSQAISVSKQYPFLEYSKDYVFDHAEKAASDVCQRDFLQKFQYQNVFHAQSALSYPSEVRNPYTDTTELYYLVSSGYTRLTRLLPLEDQWTRIPGTRYGYPFQAAFAKGFIDILATLLDIDDDDDILKAIANDPRFGKEDELECSDSVLQLLVKGRNAAISEYFLSSSSIDEPPPFVSSQDWPMEAQSILSVAIQHNLEPVVCTLLKMGVNPRTPLVRGDRPLRKACIEGHGNLVKLLLAAGIDVNDEAGPALCSASIHVTEEVGMSQREANSYLDAQDEYGSALQYAVLCGRPNIVRILIDAGADINADGGAGSALQIATERNFPKIAQMLRDAGARN